MWFQSHLVNYSPSKLKNKNLHPFSLGHHWRKSISITRFIDPIDLVGTTALQRSCEHITQCYRSRGRVGVDPQIPLASRPHRWSVKFPVSVFTNIDVLFYGFYGSRIQNTRKFTVSFPMFFFSSHSSPFSLFSQIDK